MMKGIVTKLVFLVCAALAATPAWAGEINVSAAASLKNVLGELTATYERTHPKAVIRNNLAASGTLAKQIENGAPADIYISANQKWLNYLENKELLDNASIGVFAHNTLVFVGIGDRQVRGMQDLPVLNRIAIGSPKSVPAGEYARSALEKAFLLPSLTGKLVMGKDVRECLMYAERGEVDGAFVYKTDALLAKRARIVFTVPQELYPPIVYPMALTKTGAGKPEAVAFYRFLRSDAARRVISRYGFLLK